MAVAGGSGRWPWPSVLAEYGRSHVEAVCEDGSSRWFGVKENGEPGRVWSLGNGSKRVMLLERGESQGLGDRGH